MRHRPCTDTLSIRLNCGQNVNVCSLLVRLALWANEDTDTFKNDFQTMYLQDASH